MKINTIVVDGLHLSKNIYSASKNMFIKSSEKLHTTQPPKLAALVSSHRSDSDNFIQNQMKRYKEIGFELELVEFNHSTSVEKLLQKIDLLNKAPDIHGIQIHLPFPDHLKQDSNRLLNAMAIEKDVECLTAKRREEMVNFKMDKPISELDIIAPCTFLSCLTILEHHEIPIAGKQAAVLGTGYVTGCPIAVMLQKKGALVTQCDRKTKDLPGTIKKADIIITATGVPDLFDLGLVKRGASVLDLGFCVKDGKVRGDVKYAELVGKAALVTPVPKGVGPITTAMVIRNLVLLWEEEMKRQVASYSKLSIPSDPGNKPINKVVGSTNLLTGKSAYSV